MAISKYVDSEVGQEFYKVRVVRKSSAKPGVRIDRTVPGIKTLVEAEKIERQLMRELDRELLTKEAAGTKWGKLCEEWYEATYRKDIFARDLGPSALQMYSQILRTYTSEWNHLPIEKIDRAMAWLLMERVEREVSIARRKRLRTAIDAV